MARFQTSKPDTSTCREISDPICLFVSFYLGLAFWVDFVTFSPSLPCVPWHEPYHLGWEVSGNLSLVDYTLSWFPELSLQNTTAHFFNDLGVSLWPSALCQAIQQHKVLAWLMESKLPFWKKNQASFAIVTNHLKPCWWAAHTRSSVVTCCLCGKISMAIDPVHKRESQAWVLGNLVKLVKVFLC